MTLIDFFLIFAFLFMFFALWFLICNNRTYIQRNKLMPRVGDPLFFEKLAAFRTVNYHRHVWALFLFEDPIKLYPEILHAVE